jgi:hypothetical protein
LKQWSNATIALSVIVLVLVVVSSCFALLWLFLSSPSVVLLARQHMCELETKFKLEAIFKSGKKINKREI